MRGCDTEESQAAGECEHSIMENGSENHVCYCASDACNAGPETVLDGKDPRNLHSSGNISPNILCFHLYILVICVMSMYLL